MQHSHRTHRADDSLPKDDIDDLFEKLQLIQPPPSLIQRILTSTARLPKPQPPEQVGEIDGLDPLVVRKDTLPPS